MKQKVWLLTSITFVVALLFLSSCEYDVAVKSKYDSDGSLDRTITLTKVDSTSIERNLFGISKKNGWDVTTSKLPDSVNTDSKQSKIIVSFFKKFDSIDMANAEMDSESDTLFHIRSGIERSFSWFFAYEKYSDTYTSMNRLKYLSQDDYFTEEDFAFIDRLPAEGKPISKADSFYLDQLNVRIGDHYATRAFYEEGYQVLVRIIEENRLEQRWLDTLTSHKEEMFSLLNKDLDVDDNSEYIFFIADTLGIPLPFPKAKDDYTLLIKDYNSRVVRFMSDGYSAKYVHALEVPGSIYKSNADSIAGNMAFWKPPMIKFLLKDYTMFAETRRLNYWAVLILIGIVALTVFLFLQKKRTD